MKLVDATWEQRNLGVTCVEVVVDQTDSLEDLRRVIAEQTAQYSVVKLPVGRGDAMFALSELGYTFIEVQRTRVARNVFPHELSERQLAYVATSGRSRMSDDDRQVMWSAIHKGMFDTDRVFLDPHFTKAQAAARYAGWIRDQITAGVELFNIVHADENIGYFTLQDLGDGVYYPILGGLYEAHRNAGLGLLMPFNIMAEAMARGGREVVTYISSNNHAFLRLLLSLGYALQDVTYVYVKHRR